MRSEEEIASDGVVSGLPRLLRRLEGAVLLALAVFFYIRQSSLQWLFAVLLLAPDIGMLGYLANPRVGAVAYHVFHTYQSPSVLVVVGVVPGSEATSSVRIVWIAHIGMDRALGEGLKYAEDFKRTHLSVLWRSSRCRGYAKFKVPNVWGIRKEGAPRFSPGAPSERLTERRSLLRAVS